MASRNKLLVPASERVLDQLKYEIASEFGIDNYGLIDKGNLPARVNGAIGGEMTKRLIMYAQANISNNDLESILK